MKNPDGIRMIAIFEAIKGIALLVIGFGLLSYLKAHSHASGETLIEYFHLDPLNEGTNLFVRLLRHLENRHLWILLGVAWGYALLRFIEAYGLWFYRRWAEWFAVLSAAVWLPFEIMEILKGFGLLKLGILLINVMIVLYLSRVLWNNSKNTELT